MQASMELMAQADGVLALSPADSVLEPPSAPSRARAGEKNGGTAAGTCRCLGTCSALDGSIASGRQGEEGGLSGHDAPVSA